MERLTEKIGSEYYLKHCFEENPCSETSEICLCGECSFPQKAYQKLGEYEDLEEQNRLLKQPCAVGDTVYYRYDGVKIAPMQVEKIIIAEYGINLLLAYCGNDEELKYWKINIESTAFDCKIIFHTKREAEAALKELERG